MFVKCQIATGALVGGYYFANGLLWGRRDGFALFTIVSVAVSGVLLAHALVSLVLKVCGARSMITPRIVSKATEEHSVAEATVSSRCAPLHPAPNVDEPEPQVRPSIQ